MIPTIPKALSSWSDVSAAVSAAGSCLRPEGDLDRRIAAAEDFANGNVLYVAFDDPPSYARLFRDRSELYLDHLTSNREFRDRIFSLSALLVGEYDLLLLPVLDPRVSMHFSHMDMVSRTPFFSPFPAARSFTPEAGTSRWYYQVLPAFCKENL